MSVKTDGHVGIADKMAVKRPKKYNVILLNDDYTSMGFVVDLLKIVFSHAEPMAFEIMMKVHNEGRGIAGTYAFEIAEQKVQESMNIAQLNGYPEFRVIAEPI